MVRKKVVAHRTLISFNQLILTLRYYHEMLDAGISHTLAVKTLYMVVDIYASQPHAGKEIVVSKAGSGRLKEHLIYEHGTPLKAILAEYIKEYRAGRLTEERAEAICEMWKVSHITHEENQRLRDLGLNSVAMGSPDARWKKAGIEF